MEDKNKIDYEIFKEMNRGPAKQNKIVNSVVGLTNKIFEPIGRAARKTGLELANSNENYSWIGENVKWTVAYTVLGLGALITSIGVGTNLISRLQDNSINEPTKIVQSEDYTFSGKSFEEMHKEIVMQDRERLGETYIVTKNDYLGLGTIAEKFKMPIEVIKEINPHLKRGENNYDLIREGDKVNVINYARIRHSNGGKE